ncbi:MAG: alkaline phosphatase [Spirochaetales bacterium]|nr:alkaline phosphatase [Spirochaetales bacterium]
MKQSTKAVLCLLLCLLFIPIALFAGGEKEGITVETESQVEVYKEAKYVFLFIGDGMAMPQVNSAEIYSNAVASQDITLRKLAFSQFPVAGLTTTYDASSFITDSASAGTAMATGHKTLSGVINMDPGKTVKFTTIAEMARDAGRKVGIISSVSLDHATPAAFYAKVPSRGEMYNIAVQMTESGFDFFGGGGLAQPKGKKGDQPDVIDIARAAGYTYVNDTAAFKALRPGAGKVLAINPALQDSAAMYYEIDRKPGDLSLADFTGKAIELLDNEEGFFIMVEGGKIDWACHANDAAASIKDTLAFDAAIAKAVEFYNSHPEETLIIVTGDHETGGMTLGFAGTKYSTFFDQIAPQKGSFVAFNTEVLGPYKEKTAAKDARLEDLLPAVKEWFGLDYETLADNEKEQLQRAFLRSMGNEIERAVQEDQYLLYGGYEPFTVKLTHILNQRAGIGWTSYSHTGVPVATFALGVGQELFGGYYDNTDIFDKMAQAMALTVAVGMK